MKRKQVAKAKAKARPLIVGTPGIEAPQLGLVHHLKPATPKRVQHLDAVGITTASPVSGQPLDEGPQSIAEKKNHAQPRRDAIEGKLQLLRQEGLVLESMRTAAICRKLCNRFFPKSSPLSIRETVARALGRRSD
jgi:hypothetical protein